MDGALAESTSHPRRRPPTRGMELHGGGFDAGDGGWGGTSRVFEHPRSGRCTRGVDLSLAGSTLYPQSRSSSRTSAAQPPVWRARASRCRGRAARPQAPRPAPPPRANTRTRTNPASRHHHHPLVDPETGTHKKARGRETLLAQPTVSFPPPREEVVRRRPTLPHPHECSTIGAERLSFRVRNGTGRFPFAMTTETILNFSSHTPQVRGTHHTPTTQSVLVHDACCSRHRTVDANTHSLCRPPSFWWCDKPSAY